MAILDLNKRNVIAESRPENIENRKYITQEELGTSTLFSKDHSLDHISQYISGMKWSVTYFLQLRNMNDELVQLDPRIAATIQKYHRINKLEIYLQNGIDQANITNIEFEAVINAGFLPNKHDIILAELTGGREALFTLKEIDVRKYSLHDAYWCTFKLLTFIDTDNADLYNNLIYKTVKEYVYDKNHLLDYSAPIILQSDYKRKLNLKDTFKEITDYYLDNFIDIDTCVLCPPTNVSKYTDIYLTDFLFSIVETTDHPEMSKIVRIDKSGLKKHPLTIWDAILRRDISMLKRLERRIGFVYNPYTYTDYNLRSFNMLGINFIASVLGKESKPVLPDYKDISTYSNFFPIEDTDIDNEDTVTEDDTTPPTTTENNNTTQTEVKDNSILRTVNMPNNNENNETVGDIIDTENKNENIENQPTDDTGNDENIETEDKPVEDDTITEDNKEDNSGNNEDNNTTEDSNTDKDDNSNEDGDVSGDNNNNEGKDEIIDETDIVKEPVYENPIKIQDGSYVVSNNMYDLIDKDMGILERNLKKYLIGDLCDSNDIDIMVDQYHMWSTRDQYYCIPILLVLIKDSILNTYKQL